MGASMRSLDPAVPKLRCKDFLSILDLNHEELRAAIDLAVQLKRERSLGLRAPTSHALDGRHIGLLFEKPSLRTRVTFTIGVRELGGDMVEIPADVMHADREPVHDVARNLERWVDAVVIRTPVPGSEASDADERTVMKEVPDFAGSVKLPVNVAPACSRIVSPGFAALSAD